MVLRTDSASVCIGSCLTLDFQFAISARIPTIDIDHLTLLFNRQLRFAPSTMAGTRNIQSLWQFKGNARAHGNLACQSKWASMNLKPRSILDAEPLLLSSRVKPLRFHGSRRSRVRRVRVEYLAGRPHGPWGGGGMGMHKCTPFSARWARGFLTLTVLDAQPHPVALHCQFLIRTLQVRLRASKESMVCESTGVFNYEKGGPVTPGC